MKKTTPLPRISFLGVFIFIIFVSVGNFVVADALTPILESEQLARFAAVSLMASLGMILVITRIDDKVKSLPAMMKRTALSLVVCLSLSYILVYVVV